MRLVCVHFGIISSNVCLMVCGIAGRNNRATPKALQSLGQAMASNAYKNQNGGAVRALDEFHT